MNFSSEWITEYLIYCKWQKRLSEKTIKAYRIDLEQFLNFVIEQDQAFSRANINKFIVWLNERYKPKSIKRKIASIKAFCNYLEYEEIIEYNPFTKIRIKINEPRILPKTIPFSEIEKILSYVYGEMKKECLTEWQYKTLLRDAAILELLFATGIRVSELCHLKNSDVNLAEGYIKIYGKGAKERIIKIGNNDVMNTLKR